MRKRALDNRGISVMMTVLILTSVLIVTLDVATILNQSLQISQISTRSGIAFLAAESGAERVLYLARQELLDEAGVFQTGCDGGFINLDTQACGEYNHPIAANLYYKVRYDFDDNPLHTYTVLGYFHNTRRSIEVQYAR